MSILSASSFSDHYPDALIIVARVADLVGMSGDRARFRKQAEECCQQAERTRSQLDRGVATGWMTRQTTQGPGLLRGPFVRLDVGGLIPSCRLGRLRLFLDWACRQLQYGSPLPGSEVSDKNDCTV
jgi:hypothetical protein